MSRGLSHPNISPGWTMHLPCGATVTDCGGAAFLFDAHGPLSLPTQERIWKLARIARQWPDLTDVQPGMNTLLVICDPRCDVDDLVARLRDGWEKTEPGWEPARRLDIAIVYGGEYGVDLLDVSRRHCITPAAVAEAHAANDYIVFAPGTTPGYGYLFGLDPALFIPRRPEPVTRRQNGTVAIAGLQSNISAPWRPGRPEASPTGWYCIGGALDAPDPFDLAAEPPCLLELGDRIRFHVAGVKI